MKRTLLASIAYCITLAMCPIAATAGDLLTMEGNTDRMGGDYRRIEASPSLTSCQSACAEDKDCDAYTYVKSAHHCWLKKGTPGATPNNDTISGLKKRAVGGGSCVTVDDVTCEPNTDRMGADYRRIDAAPSIPFCQNQCAGEEKCAAYTYVKSARHCWLKNGVPNATGNGDAVSGVKLRASPPVARSDPGHNQGSDRGGQLADGTDNLEGRWIFGPNGESWSFTRIERNRYSAKESGFGNASGFVTVNGAEFRLDFKFQGGEGYFLGRIDPSGRRIETTRYHDGTRFTFSRQ